MSVQSLIKNLMENDLKILRKTCMMNEVQKIEYIEKYLDDLSGITLHKIHLIVHLIYQNLSTDERGEVNKEIKNIYEKKSKIVQKKEKVIHRLLIKANKILQYISPIEMSNREYYSNIERFIEKNPIFSKYIPYTDPSYTSFEKFKEDAKGNEYLSNPIFKRGLSKIYTNERLSLSPEMIKKIVDSWQGEDNVKYVGIMYSFQVGDFN